MNKSGTIRLTYGKPPMEHIISPLAEPTPDSFSEVVVAPATTADEPTGNTPFEETSIAPVTPDYHRSSHTTEKISRRIAGSVLGVVMATGIVNLVEADPAAAAPHHHVSATQRQIRQAVSTKFIAAHRGDLSGLDTHGSPYAENTLPNDMHAISFFKRESRRNPDWRLKNFFVEGDIQFTKDGKAVWFHDTTLDRVTNCSGPIAHKTAAQLNHCVTNISAKHSHIPSFSSVVKDVASSGISFMPELKSSTTTPAEEQSVAATLDKYHMNNDRTIMQSFHANLLKHWVKIEPNVPAAQLENSLTNPSAIHKYASYVLLDAARTSKADITRAGEAGLQVGLWTVDGKTQQKRALQNPAVKIVISNMVRQALTKLA